MQQEEHHCAGAWKPDAFHVSGNRNAAAPTTGGDPSQVTAVNLTDRQVAYQPMMLVAIAVVSGIVIDRCFSMPMFVWLASAASFLVAWTAWPRLLKFKTDVKHSSAWQSCLILIAAVLTAAGWHHGYWNLFGGNEIGRFAGPVSQACCLEATILSEPRRVGAEPSEFGNQLAEQTRFAIDLDRLRDGKRWRTVSGRSELVVHDDASILRSGDRVRIYGKLVGVSPPTNPGQFDFGQFYRSKRELAFVHAYHIGCVQRIESSSWRSTRWISGLRRRLNEITWKYVGEEQAPFASAILLGNREQLSKARRNRFVETGTVHLLAISGLHVGILAGAFLLLLRLPLFRRHTCLWLTMVFVVFYAWLVEFRPPATRASILIVLFCMGRLIGERTFSMNLLAVAALLVVCLNPTDVFAIGPQLSFLAVATLAIGKDWIFWPPTQDPLERVIANTRSAPIRCLRWCGRQVRTAVLVSAVIWVLAMPIVAFRFHLVSLSGLLINPFLLLPIAMALYAGLVVLVFGWWLSPIAWLAGWFCDRNLALVEWSVAEVHQMPFGHFWTSGPSGFAIVAFYVGAFLLAAFPPTRIRGHWLALLFVGWLVFFWWLPKQMNDARKADRHLICTFLDVGHGSSVLIEHPNGENWLYDAGAMGASGYGARNIASALWYQGIDHLDAVIISHADADHFNAIPDLLEKFSVDRVYVSPMMASKSTPKIVELFQSIDAKGAKVLPLVQGDEISVKNANHHVAATVKVLSPLPAGFGENDNSNSIVLQLEYEGRRVLLPGDLEKSGLDYLLSGDRIDFDIVMAAHHGSPHSEPAAFMKWSTPEFVVISGGAQRVDDAMAARFEAEPKEPQRIVSRTDRDGAVQAVLTPADVKWRHWVGNRWEEF